MSDWLRLQNIAQTGDVIETPVAVEIPVVLDEPEPPPCPACNKMMKLDGRQELRIADAPMWGKPVTLVASRQRYRCRKHAETTSASSSDVAFGRSPRTNRLVRLTENYLVKYPATEAADHMGVSADTVRHIGHALFDRLQAPPSHWKSPDLLAIDNINCGTKKNRSHYQVIFDQRAGHAIGFVEGEGEDDVLAEIKRLRLNALGVRVFCSDLSKTNIALAKHFKNAVHVADKFHVLQACNEGIRTAVNGCAADLEKEGKRKEAKTLRASRRQLTGERIPEPNAQGEFDLQHLPLALQAHEPVAIAYRARIHLWAMYSATSRAAATKHLKKFYLACDDVKVRAAMSGALEYVRQHEDLVLAWFDALELVGEDHWSPTTTALERRNSDIQKIWKSGRGYRQNFRMFKLRVLYNRFTFGNHIIECEQCGRFEGPYAANVVLARSQVEMNPESCSACQLLAG
uniref:Putative transposase n=1 Tax=viral metagenome TaxID=1070528 RepID=A0A6H1ZRH7_9ZZZZ